MKKYLVKIGLSSLEMPMTEKQALRYGNNAMPNDLKKAGFKTTIFCSDDQPEIFNGSYLRINWGK
jgi:hypothetical protein